MRVRNLNPSLLAFAVVSFLLSASASAQSPAVGRTRGQAVKRGQVDFAGLAAWEAALPIFKGVTVPVHEPLADPRDGPLGPFQNQRLRGEEDDERDDPVFAGITAIGGCDPPINSFFGLDDSGPFIPPDTHGAVGLNFAVSSTNNRVRIHTRTGGIVNTVTQAGFWSALGPFSFGPFDPKMAYDPYANRYVFVALDGFDATSNILLGVSRTNDPNGLWNLFKIKSDATSQNWFDYPTVGFNKKWVVINGNMFPNSGSYYNCLFIFDKQDLYNNGSGNYTRIPVTSGFNLAPALTYDANADDLFVVDSFNRGAGQVRMLKVSGAVGSETVSLVATPGLGMTWGNPPGAPQSGSGGLLDTIDDRVINAVYRNGTIWATHCVRPSSGPARSSVQWFQLTQGAAVVQAGRIDDPTGSKFSWVPSIAVNLQNDACIAFARSSSAQFGSGNFALRLNTDPPGTFRPDCEIVPGQGPYNGGRWGDYSCTQIDPVDDRTFWTVQEFAVAGDHFGTWWAHIAATPPPISLSITPPSVPAGNSTTGTIALGTPAPPGGASVDITVDDPTSVTFSTPVIVPEGETVATFPIGTSGSVNGTTVVNFTATYGVDSSSAALTIVPYIGGVEFYDPFSGFWLPFHFEVGGGTVDGRVVLNFPADEPDGTVVDLTSLFPSIVSVTPSVTVPAGQTIAYFVLFTNPVVNDTDVAITASAHGSSAFSFDTVLAPVPISLVIDPSTVAGGSNSSGLVYLDGVAPAEGLHLQLSSDSPHATVDPELFIQPGKSYGSFQIRTTLPPGNVTANIGASYNGVTASATLRVTGVGVSNFVINPNTVAGGNQTTGIVTLFRSAPAGGVDITFTSSSPVINPANLHINPGQTQGGVVIKTNPTSTNTLVPIEARIAGTPPGSGKTANLMVTATGVSSVTVTPTVMHAGTTTPNGWVFLTNPAPAGGAVVTLSTTAGSTIPAGSVTVPAGANKAQFSFRAPNGPVPPQGVIVVITATYPAGVSKQTQVRVIP